MHTLAACQGLYEGLLLVELVVLHVQHMKELPWCIAVSFTIGGTLEWHTGLQVTVCFTHIQQKKCNLRTVKHTT